MKKILREMKICLWHNVLNVVNVPQNMFRNSLACFYKWKCQVEIYEMLEYIIMIEKGTKKILYFFS